MGNKISDSRPTGGENLKRRAAEAIVKPDRSDAREALVVTKLHLTGKGLSPADYRAQHGLHDHQADFSGDPGQGPQRQHEATEAEQRDDDEGRGSSE